VEKLREELSNELGFLVDDSPGHGTPVKSNGEYGFIVWSNNSPPHKLAVYARASHLWHVRIVKTEAPDENLMKARQLRKKKWDTQILRNK